MARERKPAAAARKIISMIEGGDATNAADAVQKDPSLKPGEAFLKASLGGVSPKKPARTVPSGSGSALLER